MRILHGLQGLRSVPAGAVLCIGNFDGVHRGHRQILQSGRRLAAAADNVLAVVTFEPHPLTVLRPESAPPRLTPKSIKQSLIADLGADILIELAPEPAVLGLSAEQFWHILRDEVRPSHLSEGASFRFGKSAAGSVQMLQQWAAAAGVGVEIAPSVTVPLLNLHVVPVSSSLIRWLLGRGRVRDAAICLGRPYLLHGPVIRGYGRGKQIGIPTINLACDGQLIPSDGVYAGRCTVDSQTFPAAISIGTMPTFGPNVRQVEAHLIGFNGDLYDRQIGIEMIDWLREQRKYDSIDALKVQIARDMEITTDLVDLDPSRPIALAGI